MAHNLHLLPCDSISRDQMLSPKPTGWEHVQTHTNKNKANIKKKKEEKTKRKQRRGIYP